MILLIWNEIPENLKIFMIPNDHEMANHIRKSVNTYVNSDSQNDHTLAVNDWIESGAAGNYRRNESQIIKRDPQETIDEVVIAGFFL